MKLLSEVTGKVTALDRDGRGVLPCDRKEAHVRFAYPGDEIAATLVKRVKGELQGRLDRLISPSPDRIEARCPHAGECGGCPLQALDYGRQLEWKRRFVRDAFRGAGVEAAIPAPLPSPRLFGHRNRMDYVISRDREGTLALGLKEPGRWWKTLDLSTCLMLSEGAVACMRATRDWVRAEGITPWDARTHEGCARYLVIREGKTTGERMAILVTSESEPPGLARWVEAMAPLATSVYRAVNPRVTDLSIGDRYDLLAGDPLLHEEVDGVRYGIPPESFFQTNSEGAALLASEVSRLAALSGAETVLDLYCGTGFLSLQLRKRAKRVLGIELDPAAIRAAEANAAANGMRDVEFRAEKAEDLSWEAERPDLVTLDPPRSGLHPKVLELLLEKAPPRLVYVSCNYRSLAKELPRFLERYAIAEVALVDMFPHTPHVETVVSLVRK